MFQRVVTPAPITVNTLENQLIGSQAAAGELHWLASRIKFLHYDGVMTEEGVGDSVVI